MANLQITDEANAVLDRHIGNAKAKLPTLPKTAKRPKRSEINKSNIVSKLIIKALGKPDESEHAD